MKASVRRRGSYAALFALTALLFVGFGALAVDLSMLRLADAEIQAVADAASHAGILQLRRTDDRAQAEAVARSVISQNRVAGIQPNPDGVEFGLYEGGVFTPTPPESDANAVRVSVDVDVLTPFASFWGAGTYNLRGFATAAARPLHAMVVLDITNSWGSAFNGAREGVLTMYDRLTAAASDADRIGLVTFHGKWANEFTPLQRTVDATANGVREDWAGLRTAFKTSGCGGDFLVALFGRFNLLPFFCRPTVPFEFSDESGTDHAIGMELATQLFAEQPDPSVYRAMIVVTDGQPAGVGAHVRRRALGFVDTRYDFIYAGDLTRSRGQVIAATLDYSDLAWRNDEVHTWMVSYRQDDAWLRDVPKGDGYFVRATNAADLDDIFRDIAESLPVTLVE